MNKLTIVIPLYNDLASAKPLIDQIADCRDEKSVSFLLIDNGSETAGLEEAVLASKSENLQLLRVEKNQGFGGGIMTGIDTVVTSHVGWMPGNLKVTPRDAIGLWSAWDKTEGSAVKASRNRASRVEAAKTLIAGIFSSAAHNARLFDSGGTPTMVATKFMQSLSQQSPKGYEFEVFTLLAMRRAGVRVLRSKVEYRRRRYGSSHWQTSTSAELRLLASMLRHRRLWSKQLQGIKK